MRLENTTEVRRDGDVWRLTDKSTTPMGEMSGETVLDGTSLAIRKQSFTQGPAGMDLEIKGTQVTGVFRFQGNDKPVNVEVGGPLFADSAGSAHVLATLPLADGYTATYRTFDMQKQKPKLMQLRVAGSESVKVPAGTFDAWKVEMTSAEGGSEKTTVWVAKDPKRPVRAVATMPQMGGATMTMELQ